MRSSLSRSPSSILSTGTPVQRDTTSAMSSGVAYLLHAACAPGHLVVLGFLELLLELGDLAVGEFARTAAVRPGAGRCSSSGAPCRSAPSGSGRRRSLSFSACHGAVRRRRLLLELAQLRPRACSRRSREAASVSFFSASRSIFSCTMRRSSSSSSSGLAVDLPCARGSRPRPSGRSPCPAGSGR